MAGIFETLTIAFDKKGTDDARFALKGIKAQLDEFHGTGGMYAKQIQFSKYLANQKIASERLSARNSREQAANVLKQQRIVAKEAKAEQAEKDAIAKRNLASANRLLGGAAGAGGITGAVAIGGLIKDAFEFGARLIYDTIKGVFEDLAQAEQTQIGLNYQTPDQGKYLKADVGAYAGITGEGQEKIKQQLLPLLQAGFSENTARQIREASSDLSVIQGKGIGETETFLDTFKRVQLREGLQSRQLLRMNIDEKTFYNSLGKNIGATHDQAKKLAASGKYHEQVIQTLIALIAAKETGKTGVATEEYSKTLAAHLEKFKTLPEDIFASLTGSDALKKLNEQLDRVYALVMKNKELIAGAFTVVLTKIGDILEKSFTKENIDAFARGLDTASIILVKIADNAGIILKILGTIAVIRFGFLINSLPPLAAVLESIALTVGGLGLSLATFTTFIGAVILPVTLLTIALVSLYKAYEQIKELGGIAQLGSDIGTFIKSGGLPEAQAALAGDNTGYKAMQEQNQRNLELAKNGIQAPSTNAVTNRGNVFAPVVNIELGTGGSEEQNHTAQDMGQQINDHLSRLHEQSLTESGAR